MAKVTIFARMITEVAKVVGNWQTGKERKKLVSCKEAAQRYIFANEGDGQYKNISDDRRVKLLIHFRKRFFAND